MKRDLRRTLSSLAVTGALLIGVPATGYAQDISSSLTTPPFVAQQAGSGNDGSGNDNVGGTDEGSGGGGVIVVNDQGTFLRNAVTAQATDMEAARLVQERSDDPAVRQFAALIQRQSQEMMHDAADLADRNGVQTQLAPTTPDETALIADLSRMTGHELDETFLRAFIQDQRVAVADYMAARESMPEDVSTYADEHLGVMLDQLRAAQELAMRLGIKIEES
jgi:predicted outer membrane protein